MDTSIQIKNRKVSKRVSLNEKKLLEEEKKPDLDQDEGFKERKRVEPIPMDKEPLKEENSGLRLITKE